MGWQSLEYIILQGVYKYTYSDSNVYIVYIIYMRAYSVQCIVVYTDGFEYVMNI